jgi:hypothetical protein
MRIAPAAPEDVNLKSSAPNSRLSPQPHNPTTPQPRLQAVARTASMLLNSSDSEPQNQPFPQGRFASRCWTRAGRKTSGARASTGFMCSFVALFQIQTAKMEEKNLKSPGRSRRASWIFAPRSACAHSLQQQKQKRSTENHDNIEFCRQHSARPRRVAAVHIVVRHESARPRR